MFASASAARALLTLAVLALSACPNIEEPPPPSDENEVITTITLTFTPDGDGAAVTASYADPENDGDPVIDAITLTEGTTYGLSVRFLNELEDPAEEITEEVEAEGDEHQVFIYGSAVRGPATGANPDAAVVHSYADEDDGGLPVGLANTVVAESAGTGDLRLMLRHLPEEDGAAVKVDGLAEEFATGGSAALPGDADVDVTFPLTVQ